MNILWFSWKDSTHPEAGGAEVMSDQLLKRCAEDGNTVVLLTTKYKGSNHIENHNGYKIIRIGNRYTVYALACIYFLRHLRNWPDVIIEEVNTVPFFTRFYTKRKKILLVYQLAREIWYYQMPFPLSGLGYIAESIYLRMLNDQYVITESQSTQDDLQHYGFKKSKISIVPIGIDITPLSSIDEVDKYPFPTILSLGSIRPMKRTIDQIKAFEIAKQQIPILQMKVAGDDTGSYARKVMEHVIKSPHRHDIEWLGRVPRNKKVELMRKCHLITVTSVKEGWGLIVTEAASQGTPAAVYDVDGLRDSVFRGEAGVVSRPTPQSLANAIVKLFQDEPKFVTIRSNAYQHSKVATFDRSYKQFKECIEGK